MADNIPTEAKELIADFLSQQAQDESRRAATKANKTSKRDIRAAVETKRPMTASEVEIYAKRFGFVVETGSGRHGKHLIAPDNRAVSLPDHGGGKTLATGTQHAIVRFIQQHGISQN